MKSALGLAFLLPLTGCTAFDPLNATIGSWGYVRTTNLPYGDLPRQKLDIYLPKAARPPTPVVIFFYGGEWKAGEKGNYRFAAEALTSQGFMAVVPDYRLYPQVTFPAFVEDGAVAVRWVHDNIARFGGDPMRIYLMGHSAGAHIVALLTLDGHYLNNVGLDRSVIRATAGLSGPYDFLPYREDYGIFNMSPDDTKPDPRIEPINFVDGRQPPMLLLHGFEDTVVGPEDSLELASRIRQAGGNVTCIIYPCRGHILMVLALAWPLRWLSPVLQDTANYFRAH